MFSTLRRYVSILTSTKQDKEIAKGGKLKALEDELSTLVKELARFTTQAEIKEGAIAEERKKVEDLQKALEAVRNFHPRHDLITNCVFVTASRIFGGEACRC